MLATTWINAKYWRREWFSNISRDLLAGAVVALALLDELTDTPSDKNQEAQGQGIANILTGFFGGMAGCAMLGQSVINIQSGGRKRLSTFASGVFLLFFIIVLGTWVRQIPMASLNKRSTGNTGWQFGKEFSKLRSPQCRFAAGGMGIPTLIIKN